MDLYIRLCRFVSDRTSAKERQIQYEAHLQQTPSASEIGYDTVHPLELQYEL